MTLSVTSQTTAFAKSDVEALDSNIEAEAEDIARLESLLNEPEDIQVQSSENMVDFITDMTISNMAKNPFLKDIAKELENN